MSDDLKYWVEVFTGKIQRTPGTVCSCITSCELRVVADAYMNNLLIDEEIVFVLRNTNLIRWYQLSKKIVLLYKNTYGSYPKQLIDRGLDALLVKSSYFMEIIHTFDLHLHLDDILFELNTPDLDGINYGARIIFNIYKILKSIHGSKSFDIKVLENNNSTTVCYELAVYQLHKFNKINISMTNKDAEKIKAYNDTPFNGYTPADIFIGYFIHRVCNNLWTYFHAYLFGDETRIIKLLIIDLEYLRVKLYNEILEQEKFIRIFMELGIDQRQRICDMIVKENLKKS